MKKQFLLILLFYITPALFCFSGNNEKESKKSGDNTHIVCGKIVDSTTKEEIAGAEIIIGDKKVYSDLSGNFSIAINSANTEATVKFISYKDSKIKIQSFSYETVIIEITPQ